MESNPDPSLLRKIKEFADAWNKGNIYGNARSMRVAQKYLDLLRDWFQEQWGQDTEEGKLATYLHGSLVGVIDWTTFNGRDTEKGRTMRNPNKLK